MSSLLDVCACPYGEYHMYMGMEKKSWLDVTVQELWGTFREYLDPKDRLPDDPQTMGLVQHAETLAERYMKKDPKTGQYEHSSEG